MSSSACRGVSSTQRDFLVVISNANAHFPRSRASSERRFESSQGSRAADDGVRALAITNPDHLMAGVQETLNLFDDCFKSLGREGGLTDTCRGRLRAVRDYRHGFDGSAELALNERLMIRSETRWPICHSIHLCQGRGTAVAARLSLFLVPWIWMPRFETITCSQWHTKTSGSLRSRCVKCRPRVCDEVILDTHKIWPGLSSV